MHYLRPVAPVVHPMLARSISESPADSPIFYSISWAAIFDGPRAKSIEEIFHRLSLYATP
ncbi:MAG: hypothetical protein CMF59_08520 [Leptospiraceae bacterium]|nr:hypothetical protein [Leptospiraceae bacterium]